MLPCLDVDSVSPPDCPDDGTLTTSLLRGLRSSLISGVSLMNSDYPPDWNRRRLKIFKQYDWECQDCGRVFSRDSCSELHAHHIRPISEGGGHSLENLLPLCADCHYDLHGSGQTVDLRPRETYDCVYCDFSYPENTGYKGSYCSKWCWASHKAENQINRIEHDGTICSTCFADFEEGDGGACPNCGNWDPHENNRDELGPVEVDLKNLLRGVIANRSE